MITLRKCLHKPTLFSVPFFALVVLLPVVASGFPSPIGFQYFNVCFEENPETGATHEAASPMGFGPAAGAFDGPLRWRILTYEPFHPLNLWACAQVSFQAPVEVNELYCFDEGGSPHPFSTEGLIPFRMNATFVDDNVFELDGFAPGEGQRVDFFFGMTPAGEDLLQFNNATIWHAEWAEGRNALGWCYWSNDCTGRKVSGTQSKKCDCETTGGGSWQAVGPPVGPCRTL